MYTRPVPVTAYQAGEGFLSQKQKLVRQVVLPYQYDILNDRLPGVEKSHAIENLRQAARKMAGEQVPPESFYGMVFQDSDVAKWMEAAAYALAAGPDQELEARLEETIDLLEQGQHEDGYLNSYFTVKAPGKEWTDLQEAHELYCAGHLMEAAVAYFEATGRDRFLKIMEKNADCIYRHFTEVCPRGFSGHPEVELALLKLYRATGNETYKELCAHFIDVRGQSPNYFIEERKTRGWHVWDQGDPNGIDTDYTQSTKPVREQQDAVGHAVRAVYLYTAMADLARESGDPTLKTACETLWKSITEKRMYVTGGIGSTVLGEAFTVDYDLPGDTAYAETCASIGLVFFARRMLELDPKGQYGDVMERALYNTVLAGMAQDGRRFFYVNPLEVVPGISGEAATQRHALPQRPQWYACACCPPNVARLLTSIGSYAYTAGENALFAHLYLEGTVDSGLGWSLTCETGYPHGGEVRYTYHGPERETTLALRIPGWSRRTSLQVNGQEAGLSALTKEGYAYLNRAFREGDQITLTLDMAPQWVTASAKVPALSNRAAVQRGPLVYCAEGVDNGGQVLGLSFAREGTLTQEPFDPELLGGVAPVTAQGWRQREPGALYAYGMAQQEPAQIRLVPYYAWGNRGLTQMRVWLPIA